MSKSEDKDIFFEDSDLAYEEEILRNPFSVKCWLRYIQQKKSSPNIDAANIVYERALKELPGSYKLWYNYLKGLRQQAKGKCINDRIYEDINNAFERSLVFMHKMPRIWIDYCQFLVDQGKITRSRRTFDRALRALPITQHHRIWPAYLKFVSKYELPETAVRVYRRHLQLQPEKAEDFLTYLMKIHKLDEAAIRLASLINDENFVSKEGKSKHTLWNELCELISKNPDKVTSLKVDAIIRQGLKKFTDQIGLLWNSLADYYTRAGLFDKACDVYEEAIETVITVRDFTQVFDAYAQFSETLISTKMESTADTGPTDDDDVELELGLARLEDLMERRPLLLNSVLLRQNPHNVLEWHKRVKLYEGKPTEIINTFTEAVQTVDPKVATGKPHTLWVEFAKFYETANQLKDARVIFEKAVEVNYKYVDDLAAVWCEWAEMELRHDLFDEALKLMQRAVTPPARKVDYHDQSETVQARLHKSLKLWSMYADLEESFGTFKATKAVYDRIIDLRIATPLIVLNFGVFLEESNYFEEAFKAYEKGIALFRWPNVYDLWSTYLTKFIDRYGGKKLERARDLFEQCLDGCPEQFVKAIYLLYAKLEEEHGLARHAMAVYERACEAVPQAERYEIYNIYIKRAAEIYGVTHTRAIYEKSIEALPEDQARQMCMRFADLETKLGEIDRARAVYAHCSQICDPRSQVVFWDSWKKFEVKHGNEDTVREMLRIKRSVQATYNTQVNFMATKVLTTQAPANEMERLEQQAMENVDNMEMEKQTQLEEATKKPADKGISFVRSGTTTEEQGPTAAANPDEINLDADYSSSGEDEETEDKSEIGLQAIPSKVYGGLKNEEEDDE
ncbi:hypothetical protein EB796_018665 [Bugula neritina]|uniref:Pre-mRNA-splicing factor SYF1 n=1 Tax=Bugula neritina TaxID=10212 RepID=A0A7J7JAM4_BUGNE|nr:hypothetical protein EB796_018665 [Bugula neritina]